MCAGNRFSRRCLSVDFFNLVSTFHDEVTTGKIEPFFNAFPVFFRTQKQFNGLPERDRVLNGQEMIISIYLAALSDFFVCTYSSNICRLVALLKNTRLEDLPGSVLSLDWELWTLL